ncbi:hypothetical protein [Photorhabdus khanii]|uniref:hypothetical protein n=1 Tax=Photorhabdus khanii TaxID=1004150 RepID=UPI0004BBC5C4|nr:hypothetical protein [Photorhabdus khanii]
MAQEKRPFILYSRKRPNKVKKSQENSLRKSTQGYTLSLFFSYSTDCFDFGFDARYHQNMNHMR